jgi:hypothetical protein
MLDTLKRELQRTLHLYGGGPQGLPVPDLADARRVLVPVDPGGEQFVDLVELFGVLEGDNHTSRGSPENGRFSDRRRLPTPTASALTPRRLARATCRSYNLSMALSCSCSWVQGGLGR